MKDEEKNSQQALSVETIFAKTWVLQENDSIQR